MISADSGQQLDNSTLGCIQATALPCAQPTYILLKNSQHSRPVIHMLDDAFRGRAPLRLAKCLKPRFYLALPPQADT
eukprot:scaffold159579_cov24-Prasinocladus_malaysianus.AAC.1